MTLRKILKNVSGATRQILNVSVANNGTHEIPHGQWGKAMDNGLLIADITAGLIIVNDGSSDLSIPNGLVHLGKYHIESADKVTFNTSTNGFISTNTQAAIEEAKRSSIAKGRFIITTTFNSTVGNNNWLGFSELIPGNQVPITIPLNSKLREVVVRYKNSELLLGIISISNGNKIDGRLQIYKNGLTDPTDVVHTESFINQPNGKLITDLDITFNVGDYMVSKWKDDGTNPSDMVIMYCFEVL